MFLGPVEELAEEEDLASTAAIVTLPVHTKCPIFTRVSKA